MTIRMVITVTIIMIIISLTIPRPQTQSDSHFFGDGCVYDVLQKLTAMIMAAVNALVGVPLRQLNCWLEMEGWCMSIEDYQDGRFPHFGCESCG